MTERVLTDDEMGAAYNAYGDGVFALGRAVEAAVLAKIAVKVDTLPPDVAAIVGKLKVDMERAICRDHVTAREARRRERAAWDLAMKTARNYGNPAEGTRDNIYPLPKCDKCGHELP